MNVNFKPRLYQEIIAEKAMRQNTLVVLPTGLGKTAIGAMLAKHRLTNYPNSKILFLAPTKPLAQQHEETIKDLVPSYKDKTILFTGSVSPEKRKDLWNENKIIISTPQGMENDVISRKINFEDVSLIIYDECLTENTKILMHNDEETRIRDVVEDIFNGKKRYVKSYDRRKKEFVNSKVIDAMKIPCIKRLLKIQTTNNKQIEATSDHKFLVKRGTDIKWVEAGKLSFEDSLACTKHSLLIKSAKILVSETDILTTYKKDQIAASIKYWQIIGMRNKYDKGQIKLSKQTDSSSRNIENYIYKKIKPKPIKTIEKMQELELLPFTCSNFNVLTISRIIGHLFGDGHISINKNGLITLGFSGRVEDLKIIQKDLTNIGIKYSSICSRITNSKVNNTRFQGKTNSFTCTDVHFTKLIYKLAGFSGRKTNQELLVPKWILNATKEIKSEFIGALFGSDGSSLKQKKDSQSFHAIRISFNKVNKFRNSGNKYIKQLKKILKELDVKVSSVKTLPGTVWKNGTKTHKNLLTLSNSNENTLHFLSNIGYKYCKYKEKESVKYLNYLSSKKEFKTTKTLQKEAVKKLIKDGYDNSKISKLLQIPTYQIENWKYKNTGIRSYQSYKKIADENSEPLIWSKISKIEEIKKTKYVYDLTIEITHNFVANSFVVHNCHRATGDYAYVFLAKKYMEVAKHPLILALTASPGSNAETILEVSQNLFIEEIEYRNSEDGDVKPYIQDMDVTYVKVDLTEDLKRLKMFLDKCYISKLNEAIKLGYLHGSPSNYSKTSLLGAIAGLHGKIAQGEKDFEVLKTVSLLAEALKVHHAIELVETQGVHQLKEYLEQLEKQAVTSKTKAVKNLVKDLNFRSALIFARTLDEENIVHPKLEMLQKIISQETSVDKNMKIIIFCQFRDTAKKIKEVLDNIKISSDIFVGQAKKKNTGLSQKQQKDMISRFSREEFNCLIATSVGEEGLDIPEVDLVLFYEPIPSAIRTVQRRGRTGRQKSGRVITLLTKDTRDENYRWAAHHKEKRMYRVLKTMKNKIKEVKTPEKKLTDYGDSKTVITADYREKGSNVLKELLSLGVNIDLQNLSIGDYRLSEHVVVEYKKVKDFVDSIIDGRLISQARELRQYNNPLILIEGDEDIYSQRRIHPNAIRGMIAALTINMKIPLITTKNAKETAALLKVIANREQNPEDKDYQMHSAKPMTDKEIKEYIISSFPGVGARIAPYLLKHFKSINNIINASEEELQKVELIGKIKAKRIKEIIDKEY